MVQKIMDAFYQVPELCRTLITGKYMIPTIVAAIIFLFVLFFSNRLADFLRRIFILAAVVLGVIAYFTKQYSLIWICALALVLLAVIRLIIHIFVNVRQDRINSKIEARALAKAKKRRGTWQNKKGYSGESKPLVDAPTPEASRADAASQADSMILESEVENTVGEDNSDNTVLPEVDYMDRTRIMKYVGMLKELKDAGVLTEEEYTKKQAELYSRLG